MLDDDRTEREARRCKYTGEEVNLGHVSIATCPEHRIFRFHNFFAAKLIHEQLRIVVYDLVNRKLKDLDTGL